MDRLPYEHLVSILRLLPRDALFDVAQVSTAFLEAASDPRLWPPGAPAPNPPASERGLAGVGRRDGGAIRVAVARWIARVLRFPYRGVLPLVRLERPELHRRRPERGPAFHVRVAVHPARRALSRAEVLASARSRREARDRPTNPPPETTTTPSTKTNESAPSDASSDASLAKEDAAAASRAAALRDVAGVDSDAEALAEALLRDDAEASRMRDRSSVARSDVEAVRAERGCLRIRFEADALARVFVAAAEGGEGSASAREEGSSSEDADFASASEDADFASFASAASPPSPASSSSATRSAPPPWTRVVDGRAAAAAAGGEDAGAGSDASDVFPALLRAPQPATPWSLLRARVVAEALAAGGAPRGEGGFARAAVRWGPATRAVLAAADAGAPADGARGAPSFSSRAAAAAAAHTRGAAVAWPALVRGPGSTAAREATRAGAGAGAGFGFVVGGCSCRDGVAAVVDGAAAATKPRTFLDEGEGEEEDEEEEDEDSEAMETHHRTVVASSSSRSRDAPRGARAAATALALLAHAPRALECDLGAGRFARLLGYSLWTLRALDALDAALLLSPASPKKPRAPRIRTTTRAAASDGRDVRDRRALLPIAQSSLRRSVVDSSRLAALAMAIERGEDAREDGAEAAEPSEAAAAALAVADVVGASLLRVVRSRGGRGWGWETTTAAERTMAREARGGIVRCLVSVGVLERAEGEGRVE